MRDGRRWPPVLMYRGDRDFSDELSNLPLKDQKPQTELVERAPAIKVQRVPYEAQ